MKLTVRLCLSARLATALRVSLRFQILVQYKRSRSDYVRNRAVRLTLTIPAQSTMSQQFARLVSGPTLSSLAAILFIVAVAGDTVTPIALLENAKLVLFDAPQYRSMFGLLGALHAVTAIACIASVRQSLKNTESQWTSLLALLTAQLAATVALADWAAVLDNSAACGVGTVLATIGAVLAFFAVISHAAESRAAEAAIERRRITDVTELWGGPEIIDGDLEKARVRDPRGLASHTQIEVVPTRGLLG